MCLTVKRPRLEPGQFLKAYTDNRSGANEMALDVSPLPALLRELVKTGVWEGTASDLQAALDERAGDGVKRLKAYPKNAKGVGSALRRLAPNLRETGLEVTFYRETTGAKRRLIRMCLQNVVTDVTVDTEVEKVSEPRKEAGDVSGIKGDDTRQSTVTADVTEKPCSAQKNHHPVSRVTMVTSKDSSILKPVGVRSSTPNRYLLGMSCEHC